MPSIRENALQAMCKLFADQQEGLPNADPYDLKWSLVQREPLGDLAARKRYAIAVLDTDEVKFKQVQTVQVEMSVTLEFHALLNADENPSSCLNLMLENIQRRIRSDPRLAGVNTGIPGQPMPSDTPLIIDMSETGNTVSVDSYADRSVEGAVFVKVKYKHNENDPRLVA